MKLTTLATMIGLAVMADINYPRTRARPRDFRDVQMKPSTEAPAGKPWARKKARKGRK